MPLLYVALALQGGLSTCVVSSDPAHSLGDALGFARLVTIAARAAMRHVSAMRKPDTVVVVFTLHAWSLACCCCCCCCCQVPGELTAVGDVSDAAGGSLHALEVDTKGAADEFQALV